LVGVAILLGFLLWEDLSDTVDIARFGLERWLSALKHQL
jgi:hypothetical protein